MNFRVPSTPFGICLTNVTRQPALLHKSRQARNRAWSDYKGATIPMSSKGTSRTRETRRTDRGRIQKEKRSHSKKRARSAPPRTIDQVLEDLVPVLVSKDIKQGDNYYAVDEMKVKFLDCDSDGNVTKVTTLRLNDAFGKEKILTHDYHVYKIRRTTNVFGIVQIPTIWYIHKTPV